MKQVNKKIVLEYGKFQKSASFIADEIVHEY